jgi:hypothetical protein
MVMPRKSAASLAVVRSIEIDGRPAPAADLTERQAEIWKRVVASEAAGFLSSAALQLILADFCRHVETAEGLSRLINGLKVDEIEDERELARYRELLGMRDRETKAVIEKATKLRLTNQSRYTTYSAKTASKNASPPSKPWERYA